MQKYFVIAKKWSNERQAVVKYIAGEFPSYINAAIFRDAYNVHYSANAVVVEEKDLLND